MTEFKYLDEMYIYNIMSVFVWLFIKNKLIALMRKDALFENFDNKYWNEVAWVFYWG